MVVSALAAGLLRTWKHACCHGVEVVSLCALGSR